MPSWMMPAYAAGLLVAFVAYGWAVRNNKIEGRTLIALGTAIGIGATLASFFLMRTASGGKLPIQAVLVNSLSMAICTGFVIASGLRQQKVEEIDRWYAGETEFSVLHGALSRMPGTDAVVVPTSTRLVAFPGPSGTVVSAAGRPIERKLNATAPVPLDKVVATEAGNLPAKQVFHVAVVDPMRSVDSQRLRKGYLSAVVQARKAGARSVVVVVGGQRGLAPEEVVAAAMAVARHANAFEKITWMAVDPASVRALNDFCSRRGGANAVPVVADANTSDQTDR